jgi:hypothetical protein
MRTDYKLLHGIVFSFIITAFFDIALNLLPPKLGGATRIREYFNNHTPLAAALIAGFVGAVTFIIIYGVYSDVPSFNAYNMAVIFSISALVGIPMRYSGLFPILDKHYYQAMPRIQSYIADGLSGIMVSIVYYLILGEIKPVSAFSYALPVALAFAAPIKLK